MSLNSRIRFDARLRRRIDATFARPIRDVNRLLLVEPPSHRSAAINVGYVASRVGTAFDYLFRLVLRHRNPDAAVFESPWAADRSIVKNRLRLDWPYGEATRDEIRQTLKQGYRWQQTEDGLDCMSIASALFDSDDPWLRRTENPDPKAAFVTGHLEIPDTWMAQRVRDGLSFEEIVEALFLSLGEHRSRIAEYREAVAGARYFGESFVRTGSLSARLANHLLKMSNLDAIYRSMRTSFLPPQTDRAFVEPVPQSEIDDLLALYEVIPKDLFRGEKVWLNPDLSILNHDIDPPPRRRVSGGVKADADVIVDDMLIDIKTSRAKITKALPLQDFCQLMGYFALASIEGKHRIRRLGIYYARFGYLFEFPVPRAAPKSGGRGAFLDWFRKRLGIDKRRVPRFNWPTRRRNCE